MSTEGSKENTRDEENLSGEMNPRVSVKSIYTSNQAAIEQPSNLGFSSATSVGGMTIVDPKEHIESVRTSENEVAAGNRRMGLRDWAKIVKTSGRFSHVSLEQIERVRVIHDRFLEGASFSFNYNVLLLVASVLAGLGLVSNSSAVIIASMLVSPIMGPVVGMAYGTTILDLKTIKISLITETTSLIFCIFMGCIIGLITGPTQLANDWPTAEMATRGTWSNFLVGLPVAFFSGLGVAVGLLDENTSSLVGVAISASLLPPAVNAGILWVAFGFLKSDLLGSSSDSERTVILPANTTMSPTPAPSTSQIYYTKAEFRLGGVISLALTLANIVLIWISSMLMFRVKEASKMTEFYGIEVMLSEHLTLRFFT